MDRRRELRFAANEPVLVTEVGSGRRHRPMGGMVRNLSGHGMLLKLPHSLACRALVSVETSSMLLLGEVVRTQQEEEEGFLVAITIRHSLQDLKDLENLSRALLGRGQEKHKEPAQAPSDKMKV